MVPVDVEAAAPAAAPPPAAGGAAGALVAAPVAAGAAARARPAWTRLSALLVWVLAAALFLLGCAEAGVALSAMILPSGKACAAPTTDAKVPSPASRLILGVFEQVLAAIVALAGPAWQVAVWGTGMGILTAYYFPAHDVLWLLVACDGELAFHFWLFYVVLWPVFAIGAVVSLQCEVARTWGGSKGGAAGAQAPPTLATPLEPPLSPP